MNGAWAYFLIIILAVWAVVVPVSAERTLTGGSIIIEEGETVEGFTAMGGTVVIKGDVDGDVTAFGGAMAVLFLLLFVLSNVLDAAMGGIPDDSPVLEVIGVFVILGVLACAVGAVLGGAGLVLKEQKKATAFAGLAVNGVILLLVVVLMFVLA